VVYSQAKLIKGLIATNTNLCLRKGYHLITVDPQGVNQTITLQENVAELQQQVAEMQEPSQTRSVEEFAAAGQGQDVLSELNPDEDNRDITRG
jgi:DNA polymerase III delta prime subunit